ncbi:MAG: TonB-dependent receptor [Sphingobacteriaceae bacterium]|nr:MAG: TonB-dependent receptor [Sphingobacteriaceae bacterium]
MLNRKIDVFLLLTCFKNQRFKLTCMLKHLLLMGCFFYFINFASAQTKTISITGTVTDSVKQTPLGYVTILLKDASGKAVKSTLTKDDGSFQLSNVISAVYQLNVAYVGFVAKIIPIKEASAKIDLGKIKLSPSNNQLKEVSIVAAKPILKQEVDRIAYDVQADPESKSLTALDMMRKVPMLSVDATDNIKLKGSGNYKILINGKESAMIARNPSDVLKAMPATNIEKIEVITTPPAKYDAEGLAGIINIITKKNADQGYNGSINTRYNSVYGPGLNLNGTIKQGKIGLTGYVGYNKRNRTSTGYSNISNTFSPVKSFLNQDGQRTQSGNNIYANAELSYEIDTLNLLTGTFESYQGNNNQNSTLLSNQLNGNEELAQSYNLFTNNNSKYLGTGFGLNYQLGFKNKKEQLLTTSYKFNSSNNKLDADAVIEQRFKYDQPNYNQYNTSGTKEHTFQLDYVHPLKKLNIEAGGKAILRNNFSDFTNDNFDVTTNQYINDPTQTNNFNYIQNVYGAYNTYQLKLTKWVFKGGLRVEHTTIDADFSSVGSAVNSNYNNVIPSLSLQRTFKTSSLNLGFTDRIQRPGIWQLNPFVNRTNPRFLNYGNPDLKPVVNHSVELNYSNFKKGSINASLNYAFAGNTIQNVTTIGADTISRTTYQNVGVNKRLGADLSVNYPLTKKLNININSELLYVWLNGTSNGIFYSNKGFQGHVFSDATYKFDSGYRLGLNINYDSRYVLLQGRDNYYFGTSGSISKDFFKSKLNVSASVSNPFSRYRTLNEYTRTANFEQINNYQINYRNVNVSLNYKFGKLNSSIKKNQRGISNDDVSGGQSH